MPIAQRKSDVPDLTTKSPVLPSGYEGWPVEGARLHAAVVEAKRLCREHTAKKYMLSAIKGGKNRYQAVREHKATTQRLNREMVEACVRLSDLCAKDPELARLVEERRQQRLRQQP